MDFGKDCYKDHEIILSMNRDALISSLVFFRKFNKSLEFSEDFLEKQFTWKLRHILFDAVNLTFYPDWEETERKRIEDQNV